MKYFINGKLVDSAPTSAISGNPWNSLTQLSALLHSRGKKLPAGSVVLAGAATPAVALEPGMQVRLEVVSLATGQSGGVPNAEFHVKGMKD